MSVQPPSPPYAGPPAHSSGTGNKPPTRVVIHCTAGPHDDPTRDGIPHETAAYFRNPASGGSAHYVVGRDEAVQSAWDSVVCWHAPPNTHSIGVELTCSLANQGKNHWGDANHTAMLTRAAELVAQLCLAYGVPITKLSVEDLKAGKHGICGHVDVSNAWHESTHWDPGPFFPWPRFIGMVQAAATALTDPPPPPPPPAAPTFKAAHVSGKWNATPDSWRKALAIVAAEGATVATITETTRDGVLGGVLPGGWELARLDNAPGQSECAVAWDSNVWDAASEAYATQVATTTFVIQGHERPPTTSICQPLTFKATGKVALFQALHAPSGVEGKTTFKGRRAGSVEAYTETADGVRTAWGKGWERHPQAARVLGADHNVSFRRKWVRDWWAQTFPELQSCWEKHRPILGTHKFRVIDGLSVGRGKLKVTHAKVLLKRAPKFDHRHVVADVEWL